MAHESWFSVRELYSRSLLQKFMRSKIIGSRHWNLEWQIGELKTTNPAQSVINARFPVTQLGKYSRTVQFYFTIKFATPKTLLNQIGAVNGRLSVENFHLAKIVYDLFSLMKDLKVAPSRSDAQRWLPICDIRFSNHTQRRSLISRPH